MPGEEKDRDSGESRSRTPSSRMLADHLANERTYLAWIRTGIAMMGFGFLVAKLRLELTPRAPGSPIGASTLGVLFALAGIITVILATWRHFSVRQMIETGEFQPLGYRSPCLLRCWLPSEWRSSLIWPASWLSRGRSVQPCLLVQAEKGMVPK